VRREDLPQFTPAAQTRLRRFRPHFGNVWALGDECFERDSTTSPCALSFVNLIPPTVATFLAFLLHL
jgi:hypothetical protein